MIGLARQELGIYPRVAVAENLQFFAGLAGLAGLSRRQAILRTEEVSKAMGLAHCWSAPPMPFPAGRNAGSTIETRRMLLDVVRGRAEEGAAVVYTTHYLAELEVLGATIAVLEGGRIVARGSQDSLIRNYGGPVLRLVFDGPRPISPVSREPRRQDRCCAWKRTTLPALPCRSWLG